MEGNFQTIIQNSACNYSPTINFIKLGQSKSIFGLNFVPA